MPPALDLVLYGLAAILTSTGLLLIKNFLTGLPSGGIFATPPMQLLPLIPLLVLYLAGMGAWLTALVRNPLSTAYPIGIGLSLTTATALAVIVLGEPIGWGKLLGIGCILCGAILIGRSGHD